ncbi:hypothetical protein Q4543_23965 [Salipiger sp. 1_MG-2023]|uniref:T4SS efffector SepA family protein n=1 Tax=Salipiger sp. 1_MG-2023 TaxID=3062665 RepID=UPI0026E48DEB|nr:hypothetical protein [Salipiger sp. 1_MG-2023]MDO6588528.1 hypothetical protein [Salipiger sp. 1_MG-2023]
MYIKDADYKRLNELKGIFEIEDVITKILEHYLEEYTKPEAEIKGEENPKYFQFSDIPNLNHAKFVSGSFDNVAPTKSNWKGLMTLALETGFKRLGGYEELAAVVSTNMVPGLKDDEGYHYIESLDFSFQGVSAYYAAKCIGEIAKSIKVPVFISFRWRQKDDAAHPGEPGILEHNPS